MTGSSRNGNDKGSSYRVLVAGALGAIGSLVAELVHNHEKLELAAVTARDTGDPETTPIGKKLYEIYPEHRVDCELQEIEDLDVSDFEAAVIAYPVGPASQLARKLVENGLKVIDSCAAFRFEDLDTYKDWYGLHEAPEFNELAVYGLPEIHREELRTAKLVGNPGCYPTASVLALAPLAREGLIEDVVIDAKSGVSGAGKRAEKAPPFVGTFDSMRPYGVPGHKHEPEIREQLGLLGYDGSLCFVPHLVPIDQGELVSCYIKPSRAIDTDELVKLYEDAYAGEPFVELAPDPPASRDVQRTNICRLFPTMDKAQDRILVFATIDNLWKGGASQAIQNLNLVLGLPESAGIEGARAVGSGSAAGAGTMPLDRAPVSA